MAAKGPRAVCVEPVDDGWMTGSEVETGVGMVVRGMGLREGPVELSSAETPASRRF